LFDEGLQAGALVEGDLSQRAAEVGREIADDLFLVGELTDLLRVRNLGAAALRCRAGTRLRRRSRGDDVQRREPGRVARI
jgi:hypothetical protein